MKKLRKNKNKQNTTNRILTPIKKKAKIGYKNELSFVFSSLFLIAEQLNNFSGEILSIDISYFLYVIIFSNIVFSIYKFCVYKKWIVKKEED